MNGSNIMRAGSRGLLVYGRHQQIVVQKHTVVILKETNFQKLNTITRAANEYNMHDRRGVKVYDSSEKLNFFREFYGL